MKQPTGSQQPPGGTKRPRPPSSPSSSVPSSPREVNDNHRQGQQGPAGDPPEGTGLGANGSAGALDDLVPFPDSLKPFRQTIDRYTVAKNRQFAAAFARNIGFAVPPMELEKLVGDTVADLQHREQLVQPTRFFWLVLRHDCQSTGCAEQGCLLCKFNPSRLCRRNLKPKYLIDDFLKAKCNAPLRVELVDETGSCVTEGLADSMRLEVRVLNGEKYKQVCPDNTLLSHDQLRTCIITHSQKALLRRKGQPDDMLHTYLVLDRGQAQLSDLAVTTSSEALLVGKAPSFRLLVWAVDPKGNPVPNVTYVVSEEFVVVAEDEDMKHQSDILSVTDHVSKLVNISKAEVAKLLNLRKSASEEQITISIPDHLNLIDKVGQFQELVELSEMNSDLKDKIGKLLKLSPEKMEEASQHAQSAVAPDNVPCVWWCPGSNIGLLFACKNGMVVLDKPTTVFARTQSKWAPAFLCLRYLPEARTCWYTPNHPGWAKWNPVGQPEDPTQRTGRELPAISSGAPAAPAMPPSLPLDPALCEGMAALLPVPSSTGQEDGCGPTQEEGHAPQGGRGLQQGCLEQQGPAVGPTVALGTHPPPGLALDGGAGPSGELEEVEGPPRRMLDMSRVASRLPQLPGQQPDARAGPAGDPGAHHGGLAVASGSVQQQEPVHDPEQQVVVHGPPGIGNEQPGNLDGLLADLYLQTFISLNIINQLLQQAQGNGGEADGLGNGEAEDANNDIGALDVQQQMPGAL